jgi:WD40 repeat protein
MNNTRIENTNIDPTNINNENNSLHNNFDENDTYLDMYIIEKIVLKLNPKDRNKMLLNKIKVKSLQYLLYNDNHDEKLTFLIGTDNGCISFYDVNQKFCYRTIQAHPKKVNCVLQFDDSYILTGSNDKTIKCWSLDNINSNKPVREYKGHTETIRCLLKYDENTFISGSSDHTIRTWNINDEESIYKYKGATCFVVQVIEVEKNNLWASGTGDGNIFFWNFNNKDEPLLFTLEGHNYTVWCLVKLLIPNIIASGSGDSTIRLWDYKTKKCRKILNNGSNSNNVINLTNISEKLLAALSTDGCIRFWSLSDLKILRKLVIFENDMILSCSLLINDKLQLIAGSSKEIKLYDYRFKKTEFFICKFINISIVNAIISLK